MPPEAPFDPYAVLQVVPSCEQEVVHAAFRALALKYHPDRDASKRAERKMAELNRAYDILRDDAARARYDRSRRVTISGVSVSATAAGPAPVPSADSGSVLNFGRYIGWGLRDIARKDPEYLIWLSRHSSGIRYRTEIYTILHTMGVQSAA
ncbi:MAG TPA: DnaJ domain-containing protein [Candidatus Limnocylindria bacterium]|nr:DnaJ domain-containing protein [Candidatus Limnocylindria bacterium]